MFPYAFLAAFGKSVAESADDGTFGICACKALINS